LGRRELKCALAHAKWAGVARERDRRGRSGGHASLQNRRLLEGTRRLILRQRGDRERTQDGDEQKGSRHGYLLTSGVSYRSPSPTTNCGYTPCRNERVSAAVRSSAVSLLRR